MGGSNKNRLALAQEQENLRVRSAAPSAASSSGRQASSTSGESGKASKSARSESSRAPTARSNVSASSRGGRATYDGNADPSAPQMERDPNAGRPNYENRNVDLPMAGWATFRGTEISTTLPTRPGLSKLGQAVKIGLNFFHVENFPSATVYQFDVMIGNGVEKRGVINKVWNSPSVQKAMGNKVIFDGNKLAWSGKPIEREIRLTLDLDQEYGKPPRAGGKPNAFRIQIRQTNKVGFAQMMAYLQGRSGFDNTCLEVINFADHLLRQQPSLNYTSIKRAFFETGNAGKRFALGGGVEAFKGVYQSLRVVHPGRMAINLDVANGVFWVAQPLHNAAVAVCGARDVSDLAAILNKGGEHTPRAKELKKLRKTHVIAKHRGGNADSYCIDKFIFKSSKQHKVQVFHDGKEQEMSLYDYFARNYNIRLAYPDLPIVKMTKGKNIVLPMEVLSIEQNQRYSYKMDDRQTSNMIKFAVTAPPERYADITHGLKMLNWANDPFLKQYGLKVTDKKTVIDARLLPAPTVKFGQGDAKPGTSGRWDLKGKKFLQTNPAPLKSWAVCVITGRRGGKPDKTVIERFISEFVKGYKGLGGRVENAQPAMTLSQGDDVGTWVTAAWNGAGNQSQARPQMLMFILPDKDSTTYGRIKRSCECRYGVVSQCVQYAQAMKAQPQYIANVCMKFNAKLGGVTCRAVGPKTAAGHFTVPTMVIGADVSHAAPGAQTPSMAAITVSMDKLATRYAATCQTNGYRVEMVNTAVINTQLKAMTQSWISSVGGGKFPHTIIYLRDGVSEGQYQHVLNQEVADMKAMLRAGDPNCQTKFLVIVGSKRHHVRFFPERGDRNGNAHPGTLVETGATHAYENDFYLQSHAAIKGTARPAHYHVLLNEPGMSNDQLQTMLYEQAYQYQRASTPISQHPAIYYAHLASNRAIPHDPKWGGSSDGITTSKEKAQSGSQAGSQGKSGGSSTQVPTEFDPLMPMPNTGGIQTSMWFI